MLLQKLRWFGDPLEVGASPESSFPLGSLNVVHIMIFFSLFFSLSLSLLLLDEPFTDLEKLWSFRCAFSRPENCVGGKRKKKRNRKPFLNRMEKVYTFTNFALKRDLSLE